MANFIFPTCLQQIELKKMFILLGYGWLDGLGIRVSGFLSSQYLDEFFGSPGPYIQFVPGTLTPPPNRGAKVKACSNFFLPLPPNIHGVVLNQALGQFYIFIGLRNVETQKYLLCIYRCLLLLLSTSFDLLF